MPTRALEPNVFYEPAFALAAAPVFGRDAGAMLVWSGTEPRRLLGFFPARVETRRYGVNLPVLVGWTHPYAPLGVPLVEREAAEPIIAAWLAHLAADATLPGLLLLPYLPVDSPFAAALEAIGGARRCRSPISIAMSGLSWRRAANGRFMSSRRLASTTTKSCAAAGGV